MKWLNRLLRREVKNAGIGGQLPISDGMRGTQLYDWLTNGISSAGVEVNEYTAMSVSAVYACVGLLGGSVASLPIKQYRIINGKRTEYTDELYYLLNKAPLPNWTASAMWEYVMRSKLLYGDAFVEIVRAVDGNGMSTTRVAGFRPIHPLNVSIRLRADGVLVYDCYVYVGGRGLQWDYREIEGPDMLHFTGPGYDGVRSLSQLKYVLKNSAGMAYAADEYSSQFFANGARPDFALEFPGNLSEEQQMMLRKTWADRHQGPYKAHLPAIMAGGMKVQKLDINPEDAQLLSTRQFQIEDIARIFGVPPHMVGHTEKSTSWGSGLEQQSIGYVKFTLQSHLVGLEQELTRKLFKQKNHFVEFITAGLERGDIKSRNESYRMALGRAGEPGWMTINEVRAKENLEPLQGGDELTTTQGPIDEQVPTTPAEQ